MKNFWGPNNPGDNITGVNNYKFGYSDAWNYYNIGDRVDYHINDKWMVNGRFGRYHTTDIYSNPTPNKSPLCADRLLAERRPGSGRRDLVTQPAHGSRVPR